MELACTLVGTTAMNERSSFELRSLRTGGEMWEPAVVLLGSADDGAEACSHGVLPAAGHGVAIVVADEHGRVPTAPARLVARADGWMLEAFGSSIEFVPVGVSASDSNRSTSCSSMRPPLEPVDPVEAILWVNGTSENGAVAPMPTTWRNR
jgi:hypothetical protein